MAYLRSAFRRGTMESGDATSQPIADWFPPAGQGEPVDEEAAIGLDPYAAWGTCAEMLQDRDGDLVRAWADQADGLVTFAALFSAVVTSFIIDSYTALQPDPRMITIELLRQILAQLDGSAVPSAAAHAVAFKPANSDIARNSLLFASLICSLLAAGMGIFYKEWVREYTRDLPSDPRELVRVRQLRYVGMQLWRMQAIISGISIFLQIGVAFFILAVVLFASSLHPVVSIVLNVFVIVWIVVWFGTAFCPLFSVSCPFRSPLSRFFFGVASFGRRVMHKALPHFSNRNPPGEEDLPRTLEDKETKATRARGIALDRDALLYLFRQHWGSVRLADLEPCVEELPRDVALKLIDDLLAARWGPHCPSVDAMARQAEGNDEGMKRLRELWKRVLERRGERHSRSPTPMAYPPKTSSNAPAPTRRPKPDRDQTLVDMQDCGRNSSCNYVRSICHTDTSLTTSTASESSTAGEAMVKLSKDDGVEVHVSTVPMHGSPESLC